MKKNISINISGIIFHIEEDGYEQLRNYLDTINNYFSSYEDSAEIIADIESRIAEIFLAKLKDGKQVITATDVQSLMATMGSIQDFEAIEEEPKFYKEEEKQYQYTDPEATQTSYRSKKLFRDTQRKILGGVAAGIANHFNVDPLWIRLILIILFFDVFISLSIGSVVLIGYILCWIIVPASNTIEEDKKIKKMYRNPDDRVLGGVSGGLAAYFGVDATVIRLLFVISIFIGGAGLVIYFILWIITPEAKTLTDKMQMQGEPVTLSNIETNIKKSLDVKEGEEENLLVKILLFPFRIIAIIFAGLAKALGPLLLFVVEAIRVIFGIFIIIFAAMLLFSLFVAVGVVFNFVGNDFIFFTNEMHDLPVDLLHRSFPPSLFFSSFFALFIPAIALALLGLGVLAKRMVIIPMVAWSLFAVWIISLVGLAFTLPYTIASFNDEATYRTEEVYNLNGKMPVLTLKETGMEDYEATSLTLIGHEEPNYKLVQKYFSTGSSRQNALKNAQMVSYNVDLKDSIFYFDSNIQFKENAIFRAQELEMILYIPYDKPFKMKEGLKHIISNNFYQSGHTTDQMEGNEWIMTKKGLQCTTCPAQEETDQTEYEEEETSDSSTNEAYSTYNDFKDFNSIEIDGIYEIVIVEDSSFSISVSGGKEEVDNTSVAKRGNTLDINQEGFQINSGVLENRAKIIITMPDLESIRLQGVTKAFLEGFEGDHLDIDLSGSSRSEFKLNFKELQINMEGDAKLVLVGSGDFMEADLSGAARLLAENYKVKDAIIETSGISNASVDVSNSLNKNSSGASNIENVNKKSEAQSFNNKEADVYISKAHIIYYAALLKIGVLSKESDIKNIFLSSK